MPQWELNRSSFAGLALAGKRFLDLDALERRGALRSTAPCDVGYRAAELPRDEPALTELLARVGEMFLLPARTDGHWARDVERLAPVMANWALLPAMDATGQIPGRAPRLLAFSRDPGCIAAAIVGRVEALTPRDSAVRWVDLAASRRTARLLGNVPTTQLLFADLRQQLASPAMTSPGDALRIFRTHLPMLALASRGTPESLVDFGTDRYWWRFLEGLAHYIESGRLDPDNAYVRYLRSVSARGGCDPGMQFDLADGERAVARLAPRMRGFLDALTHRTLKAPVLLYNPMAVTSLEGIGHVIDANNGDQHVTLRHGGECRVQCIDGNHRLAALWLSGVDACPVVPVWTNALGPDMLIDSLIAAAPARSRGVAAVLLSAVEGWDAPVARATHGAPPGHETSLHHGSSLRQDSSAGQGALRAKVMDATPSTSR